MDRLFLNNLYKYRYTFVFLNMQEQLKSQEQKQLMFFRSYQAQLVMSVQQLVLDKQQWTNHSQA